MRFSLTVGSRIDCWADALIAIRLDHFLSRSMGGATIFFIFYFPTDSIWNRVYGFDRAKLLGSSPFSSVEKNKMCGPLLNRSFDCARDLPPSPFCDHFDVARSFYKIPFFFSFLFSILSSAALSKRLLLWSVSPDRKKKIKIKLRLEIKRSKKGARLL